MSNAEQKNDVPESTAIINNQEVENPNPSNMTKPNETQPNAVPHNPSQGKELPQGPSTGGGVREAFKQAANQRMEQLISSGIDTLFDYLDNKIKELPETIKRLRNNPKMKKEVCDLWSHKLFEQGTIPKGYDGLPDNILIHNFLQDGYMNGLYVGHYLTLLSMAEHGFSPKDLNDIGATVNLYKRSYEDHQELLRELQVKIMEYKRNPKLIDDNGKNRVNEEKDESNQE